MHFRTWVESWKSISQTRRPKRAPSGVCRRSAPYKLSVQSLEERSVPAFLGPFTYAAGDYPYAVAAGRFNNDGFEDLAVANYYDSSVSVLLGNGDGTFDPAQNSPAGAYPLSIAVGDFDGDTNLDIATSNGSNVSILLGNGTGTFLPPQTLTLPAVTAPGFVGTLTQYPLSVAAGDLTGDGLLDLAVTTRTEFTTRTGYYDWYGNPYYETHTDGHINVIVGDASGTFVPPQAEAVQLLDGSYPISVVLEEFDSLPGLDLATADYYGSQVQILSGNNDGTFDAPANKETNWNPSSIRADDINGDGISDLVTANYYSASVLLGNGAAGAGDGTFQNAQNTSLNPYADSVTVGDINDDGELDLVTSSNYYTQTGDYWSGYSGFYTGQVTVLLGHGTGTFGAPRTTNVTGSYFNGLVSGEFDANGFSDVAVTDSVNTNVSVLINDQSWPPPPPPTVRIYDTGVTEGNGNTTTANFTVYLSSAYNQDVTVTYDTADGTAFAESDYTSAFDETVTIPAGSTSATIKIPVTGDRVAESTETFAVNLSNPINATSGDTQAIGTIYDDEPRLSISNTTVTEGNAGSVNATFTVTLSALSNVDVTVHYDTANGTAGADDYTARSGDVTIPADQWSRTVTVAVTGDRLGEEAETFLVKLSAPVNAGIGDGQGVGTGTILDNEPRISINNVSKKEGNGGTSKFVFTVKLSAPYDQAVTVKYATVNGGTATAGSDYQAKSGSVTFAAGVTSMTFTINVITDKVKEPDETFFVDLSDASANPNALISVSRGIGTILDDDNH